MRIVLLDLGLQFRNRQASLLALAQYLEASPGSSVLVACPRHGKLAEKLSQTGLPTLPLPGQYWANPALLVRLCRGLKRFRPDLVHAFGGGAARAAGFGLSFVEGLAPRIVVSQNALPTTESEPPFSHPRHFPCDDPATLVAIFCPTQEQARQLACSGFSPAVLRVLLPSLLHDEVSPHPRSRRDERFIFLASALWHPRNNLTTLVDAMNYLCNRNDVPPWEVRIIGEGEDSARLLQRARQGGAETHLCLLGEQSARELLPLCDVAVVTNTEPNEHSLFHLQAWRAGRPVICPELPGSCALASSCQGALFFAPQNAEALASAMIQCMTDPHLYSRLQRLGIRQYAQHTFEAQCRTIIKTYDELLGNTPQQDPAAQ